MDDNEIEILPVKTFSFGLKELWRKKELLYFFAWRDLKVKYRQTYLGILWAILQPLLMMCIFYLIFSHTLHVKVGHFPYMLYSFSGLALWGLFHAGITNSSESMIGNSGIIRKIYFPRLIIPLASLATAIIDFGFAFSVLLLLLKYFHQPVSITAVFCFPLGIIMAALSSFAIGSLIAALNVKYRDFRYILPFGMQLLFFSSQVVYSMHSIQQVWLKYFLYCHPLNGALEIFYYPLQPGLFDATGVIISLISMCLFLTVGLVYFRKTEAYFADLF